MDFMRSHLCISTLDLKMTDKQCRTCYVEQPASLRCSEEVFICFSDRKHGVQTDSLSGRARAFHMSVSWLGSSSRFFTAIFFFFFSQIRQGSTQVRVMRLVIPQSMFLHFQRCLLWLKKVYWGGRYNLLVSMTGGVGNRSLSWDPHLPDGSVSWFTQWPVT